MNEITQDSCEISCMKRQLSQLGIIVYSASTWEKHGGDHLWLFQ